MTQKRVLQKQNKDIFTRMCFAVRTHYRLLPTSPDWQDMTEEQVIREFLMLNKTATQYTTDENGNQVEVEEEHFEDPEFEDWDKESDETGAV